ncbi:MAG: efflux RND transporter periplasmic adaptor subunit [Sphaerochaetaceae bacterium]|nr:efflux RND transporter periplasmic adaptor subunit [Sphaerochaetaceae bacterium]MDC7236191.1 efflux RND transporter periplasmic adaptor subunit [Sphaerochaetaceae bacterium]MDC7250933.1 efflux RND transporter periplasmic adaptor subunit [Sphaerochaetaceae bacterium]
MGKESKNKRKTNIFKIILRYIVLFIILGSLVYFVEYRINHTEKILYVAPKPTVKIEKPHIGTIKKEVTFSTYIEANDMIAIIPFVQGTITSYNIKVGDFVKKDQVIATIDSTPYDQQVLQAQAAYDAYKSTFDRVESLYNKKATTAQNYDEVKAKMDAAKAQLELAKVQRDYASVKATVDGTVLLAPQAIGSVAAAPNPIAVIADLESQIVNIQVPEKYYDIFVKNKDQIEIELTRPQSQACASAKLLSIDPYIQPESKVFIVKAKLEGDLTFFRPGMYTLATITYEKIDNAYVLNQEAKKLDGSLYYYDEADQKAHYLSNKFISSDSQNNELFQVPEKFSNYYFIVEGQNTVFDLQSVNVIKNN